jgi:hypothetical protein
MGAAGTEEALAKNLLLDNGKGSDLDRSHKTDFGVDFTGV